MRLAKNNAHIVEKTQDIMERQVVQMARLIGDLLDLSQSVMVKFSLLSGYQSFQFWLIQKMH
ncbi:hypothetical protein [Legionella sainthelensi]|uniref:hypothetical protein n=1 Tax=Legionella sainthelensi TaxID=28087 RepID=UPI00048156CE